MNRVPKYLKAKNVLLPERAETRIANYIRGGRWYETHMLEYIHGLGLGGVYLDVGANIGNHSLFFSANTPAAHVYAVEPSHELRSVLTEVLALNRAEHRVSVLPFAAADVLGTVEFFTQFGERSRTAPAVRLDDVIPSGVSLVKMDIEGAEPSALRGMRRILAEDKPRLFIEAADDGMMERLLAEIGPYGYRATGGMWNATPTYEFLVG